METLVFNPNIQSSLECPVCFDFLSQPIMQCKNGHSFCWECCKLSPSCPLCRCDITQACRNITLEKVLENIEMSCKFKDCKAKLNLATRKQHLEECVFNPYVKCVYSSCRWSGEELDVHLKNAHGVKDFIMRREGGQRGWNSKSWKEADWGFSIWNIDGNVVINQSKSNKEFFYLWVYDLGKERLKLRLTVCKGDLRVAFRLTTTSIRTQERPFPFHLSLREVEKHFIEAAEGLEDGYQRLTINVELL